MLGIPLVIRPHSRDTGGVLSVVELHDVLGGGPPPQRDIPLVKGIENGVGLEFLPPSGA